MSRRILVIDADVGFQRLLRDQLSPYGFDVVIAMDGADAIARLPQLQPTLLVIAVEEPDKQGFATFNKAKKGPAANVPIVLATASVSPDSFTNHRRLKLHADEYIDKRQLSPDELLGKIDNLIGLGDMIIPRELPVASDPSLQIPVEVDEVPMELSDGDLVLEETFGEDELPMHQTVPPPGGGSEPADEQMDDFQADDANRTMQGAPIDEVLSAETDAAFDALVGGEEDGGAGAKPAAVPQPVHAREESDQISVVEGIPQPIDAPAPPRLPILIEPDSSRAPEKLEDLVPVNELPQRPGFVDAATMIEPGLATASPPAATPSRPGSAIDLGLDEVAARADEEQHSGVHDRRTLQKVHTLERENQRLRAELDKLRDGSGKVAAGSNRDFLNLREMLSAKDKEILELQRAAAEHERVLTEARERAKQLQHAKQSIEAKNSQLEQRLLANSDRVETAEAALKAAEARANEAQARLADTEHAARTEIERMASAVSRADKARMEADAAVMLERGSRDTAIEQERQRALTALRTELEENHATVLALRDQELEEQIGALRAQHGQELEEVRAAAAKQVDEAKAAAARELQGAQDRHAGELARIRDAHARDLAAAQAERGALAEGHEQELLTVRQTMVEELESVQRELAAVRQALAAAEAAGVQLQQDHAEALASAGDRHQNELAASDLRREKEVKEAQETAKREIKEAREAARRELAASRDELANALAQAEQNAADELAGVHAAKQSALEAAAAQHAEELASARSDAQRAVAEAEARGAAALQEARDAAARTLAETEARFHAEILTLRAAVEEADAQLKSERRALAEHRREVEAREAAALADAAATREAAVAEANRVHTAELDQYRGAHARETSELQARHAHAIDELRSAHARALAEKDAAIAAAAEEHRETLAEAARDAAEQAQQLRAEQARALEQADVRMRTQREADRADADRAMAAQRADHEAKLSEANDEIAQLEKGLSGARDQVRKLEEQIAALMQTIEQRDDEIRTHAAAVAERDKRIDELRGEIESLEGENASYQEQVLKAYQKIKADEATVARAKKALAIALTALDEKKKDAPG
jgi:CheY-like chemotaxis protein